MLKKVFRNVFLSLCAFSLSAILFSCAGTAGGGGGVDCEETALSVRLPGSQGNAKAIGPDGKWELSDVQVFIVTISSDSYKDSKSAAGGQTITFSNIPVGHYKIDSIGKNSNGDITAKGGAEVDIVADQVTEATVTMTRCAAYTVSFFANETASTAYSTKSVTAGYPVAKPENPTGAEGDVFAFWGTSPTAESAYDFSQTVNSNLSLYGRWNLTTYTVTFDLKGGTLGTGSTTQTIANNGCPTAVTVTKTGYTFKGWSETDGATSGVTDITSVHISSNKTYYACWEAITYTLNLAAAATSATAPSTNSVTCTYGVDLDLSATQYLPSYNGYTFKGWARSGGGVSGTPTYDYTSGSALNVSNLTNEQGATVTLYACWQAIGYTITYNLNGGTNESSPPTSYTATAAVTLPTAPTRTGYTFDGWHEREDFSDTATGTIIAGSTGNKTFYAKWVAIEYTITYTLNGGSWTTEPSAAESKYTVELAVVSLPNPTKAGCSFEGWYLTSACTGAAVTSVGGSTADIGGKTLYAKWGEGFSANFYEATYTTASRANGTGYSDVTYTLSSSAATYSLKLSSETGSYYLNKGSGWSSVTGTVSYFEGTGDNCRFIFTITENGTEKTYLCSKSASESNDTYSARSFDKTPSGY